MRNSKHPIDRKVVLLLGALMVSLASAVAPAPGHSAGLEPPAPNTVIAAIPPDLPPVYFRDPETGTASGLAVEVMNELARLAGLKVVYRFAAPWDEIENLLLTGQADLIPFRSVNDRTRERFIFTQSLEATSVNYVARASDRATTGPAPGKKVGVLKGGTAHQRLGEQQDWTVIPYDSMQHMLMDLLTGQIDLILASPANVLRLARGAGLRDKVRVIEPPAFEVLRGIALCPGKEGLRDRLNQAIDTFESSPQRGPIYERWLARPERWWTVERVAVVLGAAFSMLLAWVLMWRFREMRRLNGRIDAERAFLQTMIDSIPEPIFFKDRRSVYLGCNAFCASRFFGLPKGDIIGRTDLDLVPDRALAEHFRECDRLVMAAGEPSKNEERIELADGSSMLVETLKVPFWDPSGELTGVIGIARDITDRKRAEEERIDLEQRLQQGQKAESLGRMAGAIAHHFNNMLGAVMGNLELAMGTISPGSASRDRLVEALKASHRASEMSRLMLAYVGQTTCKREPIDLAEAIQEGILLVRPSLPGNVRLNAQLPSEGPIVTADGVQLKQILTHLISNAWEAIGDREGEIKVVLSVTPARALSGAKFYPTDWVPGDPYYACLEVSDNGHGMDAITQGKIFDPFFSTRFIGRGMGLSMVLGLLRGHRGAIVAESTPGRGSRFRVLFPLSAPQVVRTDGSEPMGVGTDRDPGLVLVVDDEPVLREMASEMLKTLGCDIVAARDGPEAVEVFLEHKDEIECVLLDLTMPRMNGWETLAALRRLRPNVPVILSSGHDEAQVMAGDHDEQPQSFLHKPYGLEDLGAALKALRA